MEKCFDNSSEYSGFDSQTISIEAELVKLVVDDILAKLNRKSQMTSGLEGKVGIEKHVQKVESLLCLESEDVRTVGIWGMGGIGKSTIADVVFHRLSSQFEAYHFIPNVREASETRQGLNELRNQLLRILLKEENLHVATPSIGPTFVRQRLGCTKVLVVLDDVSDLDQVKFLVGGDRMLFGPGSRIIVTARNKRSLGVDDNMIYKVKELDCDEALYLFHLRALRHLSPTTDYATLSREVVDYAGGNPLALTILGSVFFHCKSQEDWKSELDKLKKYPDTKIHDVLRFSYDGLGKNEREIFLDIACYHKGKYISEAKRILEACGFSANAGVRLLSDMSLISVAGSYIQMHDLIQEMGRKIVCGDKNPGKRSRLWCANEICGVLKKKRGTEAIECIVMNVEDLNTDLYVNAASFEEMHNLRLLDLYYSHPNTQGVNKVHLPPGFEFLPESLKYLRWEFYPLPSMPSRFSSENLVELCMRKSRLVQLWNKDVQIDLGSLRRIDLEGSQHLAELPDLSGSPNLERIDLKGCSSLVQLPSSFQHHAKLTHLNLEGCSSLKILPQMPGTLEFLVLHWTAIGEYLPSSIWSLEKLEFLGIGYCEKLKNLPSSTCRLNSLQFLYLCGCLSLETLPVALPSGLVYLNLRGCKTLGSLPLELPSGLKELELTGCESLGSLPVELPAGLEELKLRGCKNLGSLPKLPWLLKQLYAHFCTSLETVSSPMMIAPVQGWDQYLKRFFEFGWRWDVENISFPNCLKLDQTARSNITADAQFRIIRFATASCLLNQPGRITVLYPGDEIPQWLRYKSEGCSINITLPSHWFRQGFLGYALCIVFVLFSENAFCEWKTHHKINNGQLDFFQEVRMDLDLPHVNEISLNSDHVFAWYFCPEYVGSETTINSEDWVEASFDFMCYTNPVFVRLKRCGVSLLYAQDFDNLFGSINNQSGIDEDVVMELSGEFAKLCISN